MVLLRSLSSMSLFGPYKSREEDNAHLNHENIHHFAHRHQRSLNLPSPPPPSGFSTSASSPSQHYSETSQTLLQAPHFSSSQMKMMTAAAQYFSAAKANAPSATATGLPSSTTASSIASSVSTSTQADAIDPEDLRLLLTLLQQNRPTQSSDGSQYPSSQSLASMRPHHFGANVPHHASAVDDFPTFQTPFNRSFAPASYDSYRSFAPTAAPAPPLNISFYDTISSANFPLNLPSPSRPHGVSPFQSPFPTAYPPTSQLSPQSASAVSFVSTSTTTKPQPWIKTEESPQDNVRLLASFQATPRSQQSDFRTSLSSSTLDLNPSPSASFGKHEDDGSSYADDATAQSSHDKEKEEIDESDPFWRYRCSYCDKGFTNFSGVERHERVHTGEAPFRCNQCHRSFKQRGSLKDHLRTHSSDSPFTCSNPGCTKRFRHRQSLHRHTRKCRLRPDRPPQTLHRGGDSQSSCK